MWLHGDTHVSLQQLHAFCYILKDRTKEKEETGLKIVLTLYYISLIQNKFITIYLYFL